MDRDLFRLESAVSATACGDLTWERWPLDVVTALGLSGVRNPLGFAVVRYLNDEPSAARVWDLHLHLVTALLKRGIESAAAQQATREAIGFWVDMRCPTCGGRGKNMVGVDCPPCEGTGHRPLPEQPEVLNTAITCLLEAEQWMDRQLRSRLRDMTYQAVVADGYKINLGQQTGNAVGCGGLALTPKAPSHE